MAKARIYGMKTKCIPNSKADRMKNKQFFFHGKDSTESYDRLDRMREKKYEKETDEMTKKVVLFMKAQMEAEQKGEDEFVCPLCGGDAWLGRSSYNNHLRCGCRKCGFKMME